MSETRHKQLFDNPHTARRLIVALAVVCALLVAADLFRDRHGHYGWESWFGFHAWFGFATFFFIILAGRFLRRVLMRDEDYYDR